jgi:hypothetical protein
MRESCAKVGYTIHGNTTHLQRQIALMREKREKNCIPKRAMPTAVTLILSFILG